MAKRKRPIPAAAGPLGDEVRALRERRGLSQEELAQATEMHRNNIGGVERGERNPSLDTLVRLAEALGTSPGKLLTRAETRGS